MRSIVQFTLAGCCAAALLLSGCATSPNEDLFEQPPSPPPAPGLSAEEMAAQGSAQGAAAPAPLPQVQVQPAQMSGEFGGRPMDEVLSDPGSAVYQRVYYFNYDSSELSSQDRDSLAAHARFLTAFPRAGLIIEGHADERGTREYNLALGERRAQAVEKILTLQGVNPDQLQVISFGEERPVALGQDENAWRLNRRVELLYSGQ
jgi:peptidoglycan-associated lipoprotein